MNYYLFQIVIDYSFVDYCDSWTNVHKPTELLITDATFEDDEAEDM